MRRIASAPDYISPMKGKTHNEEAKKKISEASLRNAENVRKKHEAAGRWIPKEHLSEIERFRQEVWKFQEMKSLITWPAGLNKTK